eukprot:6630636-Prymnesium_polylepis.2
MTHEWRICCDPCVRMHASTLSIGSCVSAVHGHDRQTFVRVRVSERERQRLCTSPCSDSFRVLPCSGARRVCLSCCVRACVGARAVGVYVSGRVALSALVDPHPHKERCASRARLDRCTHDARVTTNGAARNFRYVYMWVPRVGTCRESAAQGYDAGTRPHSRGTEPRPNAPLPVG